MPPLSGSSMSPIFFSPWTTRRMPPERNLYTTYILSLKHPDQFFLEPKFSFSCGNGYSHIKIPSETTHIHTRGSAPSVPLSSFPSSKTRPLGLMWPDSVFPRRSRGALSLIWWIHAHIHHNCPQLNPHVYCPVALISIYVIHTITDIILQIRFDGAYDP